MKRHKFVIANDPQTRREYFELRAREYQRTFGYDGRWLELEDGNDYAGSILIRRDDEGKLIAGARMNIARLERPTLLPMESANFLLPVLLPEINLPGRNYAEVSRLAVAAAYQKSVVLLEMLDALHEHARANATQLVFSICPQPQARNYSILQRAGRLNQPFHILKHVAVPPKDNIEMRLCLFAEKEAY
jgi:hypothetical protein